MLGAAGLVLLPALALRLDRDAISGGGLAAVLPVWAWVGIAAVVGACALEVCAPDPRPAVLAGLTAVLTVATTGLASVVEPGARIAAAWWHVGFVEAIAARGAVPAGIDARFSWAGFFSAWAWMGDAAGSGGGPGPYTALDGVLRATPPVVALVWAAAVYVLAAQLVGGRRTPWAAAWLFLGLNWIEQDYFSPQATAMVLLLAVLVAVTGPLATRRPALTDPADSASRRLAALVRRSPWRAGGLRSPHPWVTGGQVLGMWAVVVLCVSAMATAHQLTPIALIVQLGLLTAAGRVWGGRGLLVVAVLAVGTWLVLGGREFWLSQLALATGDVGNASGSVASALGDRLVGDPGQLLIKLARVVLGGATVVLALVGAWLRRRRTDDVVWIVAALAPMGIVLVQSYGGEVLLRVLLYALPLCAVLGVEVLRAVALRWPRAGRVGLTVGMLALFATLVAVRGGNDSFVALRPQEVALARSVISAAPAGSAVLPLADQAPNNVTRVGEIAQVPSACEQLADDPVRCVLADAPWAVFALPTMDAQGVALRGFPPGWTRDAMAAIAATGQYRIVSSDGLYTVALRTAPPASPTAPTDGG